MNKTKVLLDSCIWSGAKRELTDAGYDVKAERDRVRIRVAEY
jgi:hypothetical protein